MAPTFRDSSSADAQSVMALAVPAPVLARQGDVLVLHVTCNQPATSHEVSVSGGWTQVAAHQMDATAQDALWVKPYAPGETEWAVRCTGSADLCATVTAWAGVDPALMVEDIVLFDVRSGNVNTTVAPSITPSEATTVILVAGEQSSAAASVTDPGGVTRRVVEFGPAGSNRVSSYQASLAVSAATGNLTVTYDTSSTDGVAYLVALVPAPVAGVAPYREQTTLADLTDEVLDSAYGLTGSQDVMTRLTSALTVTGTSFTVADGTSLSRGVYEINDELVYVSTVDQSTNTATIEPWGRGYRGSRVDSHSSGDRVAINPRITRLRVMQLINQTIQGLFPWVFAVGEHEFPFVGAVARYDLPPDADAILRVTWNDIGVSGVQIHTRRWREDVRVDRIGLEIFSGVIPGQTVRVLYRRTPGSFTNPSQTLADVGMPESVRDVIVAGTTARLLQFLEPARLQSSAVETGARANEVPVGAAISAAREFQRTYMLRRDEEARRLQRRFQPQTHFVR